MPRRGEIGNMQLADLAPDLCVAWVLKRLGGQICSVNSRHDAKRYVQDRRRVVEHMELRSSHPSTKREWDRDCFASMIAYAHGLVLGHAQDPSTAECPQ